MRREIYSMAINPGGIVIEREDFKVIGRHKKTQALIAWGFFMKFDFLLHSTLDMSSTISHTVQNNHRPACPDLSGLR